MDTAIDDAEELVVATRVTKEPRIDGQGAARATAARLTQRVLYVEITVARVRHAASRRSDRVVASVPCPLEHQHHLIRIIIPAAAAGSGDGGGDVTRQVEDGVEAGITSLWWW